MIIKQGERCDIPEGHENAKVTNMDAQKSGSYDITGDGIHVNKQISGGETQETSIMKDPAQVTNTGKPKLDVAHCEKPDQFLPEAQKNPILTITNAKDANAMKTRVNPIKTRNIFALAVNETKFMVTNNSGGNLANQYILVFITPVAQAENWVYAAWQQLRPGEGGTSNFTLNQIVSGQMVETDGSYTTNSVTIDPNYVSILTNSSGLQPVLGTPQLGTQVQPPTVTSQQSGMKNNTSNPGYAMYAQWSLNGNLAVQSQSSISAGGTLSAFELNTNLYWSVGDYSQGPNFTYNQITSFQTYSLPANTPIVSVTLTYNSATQQFEFSFDPPSD